MTPTFRTSAPDAWVRPRAHRDASQRLHHFGPIVPLPAPSLWRANWPGIVGTAALSGATLFAFGLLTWSFS